MQNLWLKAARKGYRFSTSKGSLNSEQLFDLSETQLHELYLSLENSVQGSKGLMGRKGNKEVEEKMQIVKDVFNVLQDEKAASLDRIENSMKKEKILTALEEKEMEELKGKSVKTLRKMAKAL